MNYTFSESISKETREEQRAFLSYCSEILEIAYYRTRSEDSSKKYTNELDLKKFARSLMS